MYVEVYSHLGHRQPLDLPPSIDIPSQIRLTPAFNKAYPLQGGELMGLELNHTSKPKNPPSRGELYGKWYFEEKYGYTGKRKTVQRYYLDCLDGRVGIP